MSSVQAEPPKVSPEQILAEMGQLALEELEQVVHQGRFMIAERKVPHLSKRETELFTIINQDFPEEFNTQYRALSEKLPAENFSEEERILFLSLNEKVEEQSAIRLFALIELAEIRQISIEELATQLGISSATVYGTRLYQ